MHFRKRFLRRRLPAAFTLIEVVIVLAIAAVLAGIALPSVSRFIDRIEVRGAVTEIASTFSLARHMAIARGAQVVVDIDAARKTLSIRAGGQVLRSRDVGAAHGVNLSTNRTSITYSPIGVGYGASNFTLVVSRNRAADSVVVSRLGRVRH